MSARFALLVDDDPVMHLLVSDLLRHLGLTTQIATTVDEAWSKVNSFEASIILLDLFLDEGTTTPFINQLAASSLSPKPPILLVSSHEDVNSLLGESTPPDAVLRKPFSLNELKAALQALGVL
jgi:DNA-binding response OmpR family regulator